MSRSKRKTKPKPPMDQSTEQELGSNQLSGENREQEQVKHSYEMREDSSDQVNESIQGKLSENSSVNIESNDVEYRESELDQNSSTEINMDENTLAPETQEPAKLSLLPKYKELVFLVKDRNIDNVNTFREVILREYPDYSQDEVDDVWVAIATYATNVHRLYEKICNYYRIFVQKIVEDKQLSPKEKRVKIKEAVSGSPLASYVLRLANNEYQELYKQLYYELDGDINLVLKLLGT
jgi:hypothetical protein